MCKIGRDTKYDRANFSRYLIKLKSLNFIHGIASIVWYSNEINNKWSETIKGQSHERKSVHKLTIVHDIGGGKVPEPNIWKWRRVYDIVIVFKNNFFKNECLHWI